MNPLIISNIFLKCILKALELFRISFFAQSWISGFECCLLENDIKTYDTGGCATTKL